jgi:hypothetical protein
MTPCARLALSRRCRALVAWIAVLAIFVQAMLPALHALAMGSGGMVATADAGSTVVICTPTGFKRITLGGLPTPWPAPDGSSQPVPAKVPLSRCARRQRRRPRSRCLRGLRPRPAIAATSSRRSTRLVDRAYRPGLQARAPPPTV